jgi:hypothetical protein
LFDDVMRATALLPPTSIHDRDAPPSSSSTELIAYVPPLELLDADAIVARYGRPRPDDRTVGCEGGRVVNGDLWVVLSPSQEELVATLVDNIDALVTHAALASVLPSHPAARRSMLQRVRRKLSKIGLRLVVVRGRGYIVERCQAPGPDHGEPHANADEALQRSCEPPSCR